MIVYFINQSQSIVGWCVRTEANRHGEFSAARVLQLMISVDILRIYSVKMICKIRFQGCALQSGGRMVVSSSMLVMGDGFLWRRVRLVVADGQRSGGNELRVPFFKKGSKTSPKLMLWSPIMCSTPTVFTAKFWISKERSDPFDEFSSTTNITRGWRLSARAI